jgi:hypothetical protein
MKVRKNSEEYATFTRALRKVLTVSHSDMQKMLEQEQAQKTGQPKPGPKPSRRS